MVFSPKLWNVNLLRLIFVLLSLPALVSAQDLNPSDVANFWEYIEENEASLSTNPDIVQMFEKIEIRLDKVHKDLVFEFSSETVQPRHFVISAGGISSNFPAVKELVKAAPDFQNLEIIAFRQPVDNFSSNNLVLGDFSIKTSELSFIYFTDRDQFDLVVIHDAFSTSAREQAIGYSFLVLDAAVGEYRVATEVGTIDFLPKAAISDVYQPLPINLLPLELDHFIRARIP